MSALARGAEMVRQTDPSALQDDEVPALRQFWNRPAQGYKGFDCVVRVVKALNIVRRLITPVREH